MDAHHQSDACEYGEYRGLAALNVPAFAKQWNNCIVGQLGIQGVGYGGPQASGSPYFNVQGYSGFGDNFLATPMRAWDTILEGRDNVAWEHGRHSFRFGGAYRWYIWPMWGFFQNRGYYQFTNGFTTETQRTIIPVPGSRVSSWGCRQ